MIYADYNFYRNEYLLGRPAVIPLNGFLFYARAASEKINRNNVELDEIPDYLRLCTCEVAELLYRAEIAQGTPDAPAIKSESVGPYSVSYADKTRTGGEISADTRSIINKWLAGTPLHNTFVYRGVMR